MTKIQLGHDFQINNEYRKTMKITSFVTSHVNDVEEKWASRSTSPGSLNKGFTLKRHKRKSTYFHVDIWEDKYPLRSYIPKQIGSNRCISSKNPKGRKGWVVIIHIQY